MPGPTSSSAPVNLHPLMSRSRNALIFTPPASSLPRAHVIERFCPPRLAPVPRSLASSLCRGCIFPSSNKTRSATPTSLSFFSVFLSFGLVISKLCHPTAAQGLPCRTYLAPFHLLRDLSHPSLRVTLRSLARGVEFRAFLPRLANTLLRVVYNREIRRVDTHIFDRRVMHRSRHTLLP